MAIKIITGVLGAGKTYFCVSQLLSKYYTYDDNLEEWNLKKPLDIITNIDGLKLPCLPLDLEIQKAGGLSAYFNINYHHFDDTKSKLLIIDEAQKFFDRKFYDKSVFEFFQWSRHLGIDIYLITQDIYTLSKELQNIAEYEVKTARASFRLGPEFRYEFLGNGEHIKYKVLKKDKRVFMAYRSRHAKELEKIPSAPRKYLAIAGVLVLAVVLSFNFVFGSLFSRSKKTVTIDKEQKVIASNLKAPNPPLPFPVSLPDQVTDKKTTQTVSKGNTLSSLPPPPDPAGYLFEGKTTEYVGYVEVTKGNKTLDKVRIYERNPGAASLPPSGGGAQAPSPLGF